MFWPIHTLKYSTPLLIYKIFLSPQKVSLCPLPVNPFPQSNIFPHFFHLCIVLLVPEFYINGIIYHVVFVSGFFHIVWIVSETCTCCYMYSYFAKLALSFSSCLVDSLEFLTYKTMSYVIRDSFTFSFPIHITIMYFFLLCCTS